jgi:adenylate cyclase class 2
MECEIRVLNISVKDTISKLKGLGAKKLWAKTYNRIIFDFPDKQLEKQHGWIRLRTDGKEHSITFKQLVNKSIDGTKEIEIEVNKFEETRELLKALGLQELYFQENKRTRFVYKDVEFDIDEWPLIPAYLEIEADSKQNVLEGLKHLGFKEEQATTLHGKEIFAHYGIDVHSFKELKFEEQKKF